MATILGLSCDYHDAAAAIVVDGEVVAAAEEERFTRRKHDRSLPRHAAEACLEVAGMRAHDIDHIAFYEKPLMVLERYLHTRQRQGPRGVRAFASDAPGLFRTNLLVGYRARKMLADLGVRHPPPVRYVEHHLSHAAAAFHPSGLDQAAILTVDGLGEWATATIGVGSRRRIELLEEQRFPNSLGLVYSLVTAWCGFTPNDGEYKVMGLAPYGTPRYLDALQELVRLGEGGHLEVDGRAVHWFSDRALASKRLAARFGGPPRRPEDALGDREADLAASVQRLTEEAMLAMARRAHELTGEPALCLAGGVALNCVANGRILREGPFDQVWVQPAAGDAGSAIGAALAHWHEQQGNVHALSPERRSDGMRGAFLGPAPTAAEVDRALAARGIDAPRLDPDAVAELVAERIDQGAVVGVCRGPMEFGPRALGNRSLLADPRDATIRERLNVRVKGRESFRPFAPAVLAERAAEWFDLEQQSPYMLVVAPVLDRHLTPVDVEPGELEARGRVPRSTIPACTHVDGSARIQTVDAATNPSLHRILSAFERRTGCPILVNTSFNLAGEPIVCTAEDALRTAAAAGVDLLVLGDRVVEGTELRTAEEQREAEDAESVA